MKTTNRIFTFLLGVVTLGSYACSTIPKGAVAVQEFEKEKYLGKWFEIARFDFKFERNLDHTTAEYSLNDNGTIKVVNRGFNILKNKWSQATGKAKFVGNPTVAMLKVSFFGPFYAGYNVIAIDKDYKYALVAGANLNYLWILSRETTIPDNVKKEYIQKAKSIGFDTSKLMWIKQ